MGHATPEFRGGGVYVVNKLPTKSTAGNKALNGIGNTNCRGAEKLGSSTSGGKILLLDLEINCLLGGARGL